VLREPALRVRHVPGGVFPLKGDLTARPHWTREAHWKGVAERQAAWEERQRLANEGLAAMPRDAAGRVISGR
jgi:hypothetical protein